MQLSFKNGGAQTLAQLPTGSQAYLERLDLPEEMSQRLMELGFMPGTSVVAAGSAPGGDPRIFRVDGSEIALRRDTASHLYISSQPIPDLEQI
jgi:Fe2+ transport system protein FeoA